MKKHIALLLAVLLMTAACPAWAEEGPGGDWYAAPNGLPIQLTLNEDGTFALTDPLHDASSGAWEERDGYVYLTGEEKAILAYDGASLVLDDADLAFSRKQPETYAPAEPAAGAAPEDLAGYWQCRYVDAAGTALPADLVDDITDLYVEGHSAVLGGPAFGDVIVRMTWENGALTCEQEGKQVRLELQEDGMLRLTVTGADGAVQIRYLLHVYAEALDGEQDETP